MSESQLQRVRAAGSLLVIAAVLVAFLYQMTTPDGIQPWLIFLMSVLTLAAGAALFGIEALRAAGALVGNVR